MVAAPAMPFAMASDDMEVQRLLTQTSLPLQTLPQAPQWFESVCSKTHSVPVDAVPATGVTAHWVYPGGQLLTHFEFLQLPVFPQDTPQPPQLFESVVVSTQRLLHAASPAEQVTSTHAPAVHTELPGHALVQLPHAYDDEYKFRHRESQAVSGGTQAATQPAAEQSDLSEVHLFWQLPHVSGLDRFASQPLAAFPSQSAQPKSQESMEQAPA